MMNEYCSTMYIYFFIWLLNFKICGGEYTEGPMFIFPQNADDIIIVAENTELRIPFAMDGVDHIQQTNDVFLSVEKVSINNTNERLCTILYTPKNKSYLVSDASHHCRSVVGPVPLLFAMNVSRQDDGTRLMWRAIWRQGTNKTFLLNITYPTEITSLKFHHSPSAATVTVDQNSSAVLSCSWNHGNPPQTVRLLDGRRQVLNISDRYSAISYLEHTWRSVTCDDAGVFTCEAAGADVNRSVRLLVRCKPEFEADNQDKHFSIKELTQAARLYFQVKIHSLTLTDCQMEKISLASDVTGSFYRKSGTFTCSLSGHPPDCTLTLELFQINDTDSGLWRLQITNDFGTSTVEFTIIVIKGDSKIHTDSSTSFIIIIGGGAGGGFVLIIIIIIVVVKCRKSRDVNIQSIASIAAEKQAARKSDSSAGTGAGAAGNDSKSGGSSARSSSSGSDKPSSNPNYTSTALQEVEIHAYMDLHTRDPTYAATASKKDNHTYIELRTKRMQSEPPQPPAEGSRNSAIYANQGRSPKTPVVEEEEEDETNYYNTA